MTGVDLADEDAKFLKYLTDNGWEGDVGEDDDMAFVQKSIESRNSEEGEENVDEKVKTY